MNEQKCRICGCTEDNCSQCIKLTGHPCHWVEEDLCSACKNAITNQQKTTDMSFFQQLSEIGNVDITLRIMQKGDKLTINLMPGSPKSTNKPYVTTGTGAELDEGFFAEVFPAVQELKGLVSNKEEVLEDARKDVAERKTPAKKAEANKKSVPKKPEKKTKEQPVQEGSLFDEGAKEEIEETES